MADMISILIFVIFAYFAAKKLIIPAVSARVAAKRAAKNLPPVEVAVSDSASGMAAIQAAVQATGHHSITCFDMRLIDIPAPNDDTGEGDDTTFVQRITYAVNEMLLNASTRGDAVRLNAVFIRPYTLMLYVTYTVR